MLAATGPLMGAGDWGPWPDLRFLPRAAPGLSLEALKPRWAKVSRYEAADDGVYFFAPDDAPRRLRVGQDLGVYYRNFDGSAQGLAGRGEVVAISRKPRVAQVKVHLAHLTQWFGHSPWRGWQRQHGWRPGFEPGKTSYFLSAENLSGLPDETWAAVLAGEPHRGLAARDMMRVWGSPAARSSFTFAHGKQEQWVWHLDPRRRAYAYVDSRTLRVTGWHTE